MRRTLTFDLAALACVVALTFAVAALSPRYRAAWLTVVYAQATTCPAGTTSATVKSNTPFTMLWCSPATDNVTGANAYGLGATAVPLQAVALVAGPFSDGLVQMRGTVPAQPRGHYTFTLKATNGTGEGGASAPFDLGVVDPVPTAPVNLRVQ